MTLANWPYGDIDDKTVDGIMKALDLQSEGGRIDRIKRSIGEALVDINNIAMCKGETPVWDDQTMGLRY
jgi:hypothetical protein